MPLANSSLQRDGFISNPDGSFTQGTLNGSAAGFFSTDSLIGATNRDSNVFDDWFYPQDKELRQQGYQMMQDYLSPQNKMAGMRAAGINPLTAAAGIAGSPSSTPQPASSVNPIGDIAGAVGAAASGFNAVSEGVKALEDAKQVKRLADSNIAHQAAEIDKWCHDNNYTDAITEAFQIDNQTRSEINKAELNVKRQQFNNMVADADRIKAQRDYIQKQVDWYDTQITAEVNLANKRALEAEKHGFLMDEQKRTEQMENDFCDKYHYRRGEPFENAMADLWFQGDYEKVKSAQDFMFNYKYNVSYQETEGEQTSLEKHAYSIANAQETARSLNSIVTDWNQPASSLWGLIEKSFNVSGNKHGQNNIGSAQQAKTNPDAYSAYTQFLVAQNLLLDEINNEISAASGRNEFSKVRDLTKQRDGLMKFIQELTFDKYVQYMSAKQ